MSLIRKTLIFALSMTVFNRTPSVTGLARFTNVPPSVLYVSVGKTARFDWDYTVDNWKIDFQEASPLWSFYWQNNSESIIGYEFIFEQRRWTINYKTCPKRLLQPTRVSREPNATLVIQNVTTGDSGTYGCSLLLTTQDSITSKVKLTVTTIPKITIATANTSTIMVKESDSLDIRCSATGSPTPNVSWVSALNNTMSGGGGNATLRINNITILQGGWYECRASNNPNEAPVTADIEILVMSRPRIDIVKSTKAAASTRKNNIRLQCVASGQPLPRIKWYGPRGLQIVSGIENKRERSVLTFVTNCTTDFGQYRCHAENEIGQDEHFINVTQLLRPQIDTVKSTRAAVSLQEKNISLQCVASGEPLPRITWYGPSGSKIISGIDNKRERSVLTFKIKESSDFGQYRCHAESNAGEDEHFINVTQLIATTLSALRTTPTHDHVSPSSSAFYQGKQFAVINLSTTCILFIVNVVLITYICFIKCTSNSFKDINREECLRCSRSLVARIENEETAQATLAVVENCTGDVSPKNAPISPNEDYERISEKSGSSVDNGNTAQWKMECDVHLLQPHHDYQELNADTLMPDIQSYQALNRILEDRVTRVEPSLPLRKYESLNLSNKPQNSEYQKLHLYADIGDKT